jgi:hypothetical protein
MSAIVFVHGIGVREKAYKSTWWHLSDRLAELFPDRPAEFCHWGGEHGARIDETDEPARPEPDPAVVELTASLTDPFWELTALAEKAAQEDSPFGPLTTEPVAETLRRGLRSLGDDPVFGDSTLDRHAAGAARELLSSPTVKDCLDQAEKISAELPGALAHAYVALAVRDALADGDYVSAPGELDLYEGKVLTRLGGAPMGTGGWLLGLAGRLVRPHLNEFLMPLSQLAVLAREPIMRGVTPYLGDVMVYLARGERIREAIAGTVESLGDPVDLIAHSLGGIACFDLLASGRLTNVRRLITVGTQIPYLYQIDALPGLRRGGPVPALPHWVNVYDRHDALGFPAEGILPGVRDRRTDSGLPFPLAHSAYFRNDRFYDVLAEELR